MNTICKILSVFLAASLALGACQRLDREMSEEALSSQKRQLVFHAVWNEEQPTKTVVSGTDVLWTPAEQINIFSGAAYSGLFTSVNTEPAAVTDFIGELSPVEGATPQETDVYWAVYPYDGANTCDGQSVSLSIPQYQTGVAGSFADNLFPAVAQSANTELVFYNVCGGASFTVTRSDIRSVTFRGRGGENLAGRATVIMDASGLPAITGISGIQEVSVLAPDGGTFIPGQRYFAVMVPQTLSQGLEVTYRTATQMATYKKEQSVTIARSRFGMLDGKDEGLTFQDAPIDRLAFADMAFADYVFTNFDTDGDGELSQAEREAVSTISVSAESVVSLEGIAYFPNLSELYCYGRRVRDASTGEYVITGRLTSLDVSHNPALTVLEISCNQLTALDVTENPNLSNLSCSYNALTALDVSQNTDLSSLYCYGNQLSSLNVRQNVDLKYFYCHTNQIGTLDVTQNTALTELNCGNNQLTALDVSQNTLLQRLYCYANRITNLNVLQNTQLQVLSCYSNRITTMDVSNCPALIEIDIQNNQLVGLDVSRNSELKYLYMWNNPDVGVLDVSHNAKLERLDCEATGLQTLDLSYNPLLNYLYCSGNELTELDVSNNLLLTYLYCMDNDALAYLYMQEGQTISQLYKPDATEIVYVKNYGPDAFPDDGFWAYIAATLDLNGNGSISEAERLAVTTINVCTDNVVSVEGIQYFPNLATLKCNGSAAGSGKLASIDISQNQALTHLEVENNVLSSLSLGENPNLATLYCRNNALTELDLTGNLLLKQLLCDGNAQLSVVKVAKGHTFTQIDRPDLVQQQSSGNGGGAEGYGQGDNGYWD